MRSKPVDYDRVWVSNVTGRVFHRFRETVGADYDALVATSCQPHYTLRKSWAPGSFLPISWAADLGFRPCKRCRWMPWQQKKYGGGS